VIRSTLTRRRPATHFRKCIRSWFRHEGRIVRMLSYTDYSACETGGEPRIFYKLLDHTRYAKGMHCLPNEADFLVLQVLPHLQPGEWIEVVY